MRVVSLCPSLTELVFDLGRGRDVVGVTRYCVHPCDQLVGLATVGGTKDPDIEQIVALEPDLVLLNEEENRREDHEALAAAGVECHTSLPRTTEDTAAMVRSIGVALDAAVPAEEIASDIESRAERVREAALAEREVRWAYMIWREPWMTVNRDTFSHALLELAGGRNVFAEREPRYPTVEPADLAAADPELVLLCSEPFPFEREHIAELSGLTGLCAERFALADGEYLSWHGSRTPAGIDHAEELIRSARER
ncbi:MAG: cobalamin-binding protein [Planctomycetes bacterium]|jgi:ABC-type Fe3+-hydroxamate transport system substrate-binding protein|nr:cobalamin-binding protein [Planctomycetota bacterium]MDP6408993.1 helical backbone metal receptor [Planctomycetota bacterium]